MSTEKINLNKQVFDKKSFLDTVDISFKQLGVNESQPQIVDTTIDEFFQLYTDLFYQIPKTGEINSHEYLIKTSTDYIGFSQLNDETQALLDEITQLREELLNANQQIIDLTTSQNSTKSIKIATKGETIKSNLNFNK